MAVGSEVQHSPSRVPPLRGLLLKGTPPQGEKPALFPPVPFFPCSILPDAFSHVFFLCRVQHRVVPASFSGETDAYLLPPSGCDPFLLSFRSTAYGLKAPKDCSFRAMEGQVYDDYVTRRGIVSGFCRLRTLLSGLHEQGLSHPGQGRFIGLCYYAHLPV